MTRPADRNTHRALLRMRRLDRHAKQAVSAPNPSDLADEGRRVLFTFLGVGIAVIVTLIANELQKRHAPATPATT
jgi:hypothetical protein